MSKKCEEIPGTKPVATYKNSLSTIWLKSAKFIVKLNVLILSVTGSFKSFSVNSVANKFSAESSLLVSYFSFWSSEFLLFLFFWSIYLETDQLLSSWSWPTRVKATGS